MSLNASGIAFSTFIVVGLALPFRATAEPTDWQQWIKENPTYGGAELPASSQREPADSGRSPSGRQSDRAGRVRPLSARINTKTIGNSTFYEIVGEVKNSTREVITNIIVYYEVKEGYSSKSSVLDSGGFHIKNKNAYYKLPVGGKMKFEFPISTAGKLRLLKISWEYMDGTVGINDDTRALNEYL